MEFGKDGLRFWRLKVMCGAVLILLMADALIWRNLDAFFALPTIFAQALVLLGGGSVIYHYHLLQRQAGDMKHPRALACKGGLFRFLRHPMYLSDMVMYLGFLCFSVSFAGLIVYGLAVVSLVRQAQIEDENLRLQFSDDFLPWAKRTGLLFPRLG